VSTPKAPPALATGPILPTLLRLAAPNVLAMLAAAAVGIAETWYVGLLGVPQLAAMALVFPFVMLTQMFSAGAMGGGVSSAISRAMGAGDRERARALAVHAAVIALVMGVGFVAVFELLGPMLYELLGGKARVLEMAVLYSSVVFAGALPLWICNTFLSVLRGFGDMRVPSLVVLGAAVLQVVLGSGFALGWGPFPRLEMAGVGLGQAIAATCAAIVMAWLLLRRPELQGGWRGVTLQRPLFNDILKVGALACLSPLQTVAVILIFTGLVARYGTSALAGYGIGARLEFLLIPIAFGIGVASVPMVGMAIGAGDVKRARRVAWTAGGVSALVVGAIGLLVTFAPQAWAGWFTDDPRTFFQARSYLMLAGPFFAFYGLGLTLYFASQGAGRVLGPVLAATLRLALVAIAGSMLAQAKAPVWTLFALVGMAMGVYGIATAASVWFSRWKPAARPHGDSAASYQKESTRAA
jgi:putative MATE family efflux protein